jgi:hypothetical protein
VTRSLVALALTLLLPLGAAAQEALSWRLATGTQLRYRATSDQTSKQTVGDFDFETKQTLGLVWSLSVDEVDADSNAAVRTRYDEVRVDLNLMSTGRLSWDSTNPEDLKRYKDPTVKPYVELVGSEFGFSMRPDGGVVEGSVRGFDAIRKEIRKGVGGGPFAEATIMPALADEAIRAELERSFRVLPEGPVGPGARWENQVRRPVPVLGALRFDNTFRLARFEETEAGRVAVIELTVAITPAPGPEPPADAQPPALLEASHVEFVEGGGEGTVRFLVTRGCLEGSQLTSRMTLRSRAKEPVAPNQSDGGSLQTVRTEVTQVVTVELLD